VQQCKAEAEATRLRGQRQWQQGREGRPSAHRQTQCSRPRLVGAAGLSVADGAVCLSMCAQTLQRCTSSCQRQNRFRKIERAEVQIDVHAH
jgi:hypothetical protein